MSNTATVEKIKQNEMNEKDDKDVGEKKEVWMGKKDIKKYNEIPIFTK